MPATTSKSSLPMWERGLKHRIPHREDKGAEVTPHVGVWIETSVSIENIVCPVNILLKHFVNSKRNSNFAV